MKIEEIKIEEMTINEAKEAMKKLEGLQKIFNIEAKEATTASSNNDHWIIGEKYLIRTVTFYQLGVLKKVTDNELVLTNASWVQDTGRFNLALKEGLEKQSNSEIEPFQDEVIVGRGAIVDATIYRHSVEVGVK